MGAMFRLRGLEGSRTILLIDPDDMLHAGLEEDDIVSLVSDADDDVHREVAGLKITPFNLPNGSVGGYYPEMNVLIPLWYQDQASKTPASKGVPVRIRLCVFRQRLRYSGSRLGLLCGLKSAVRHLLSCKARRCTSPRRTYARTVLKEVVEMPDQQADRLLRSLQQSHSELSNVLVKEMPVLRQPEVRADVVEAVVRAFQEEKGRTVLITSTMVRKSLLDSKKIPRHKHVVRGSHRYSSPP